MKASFNFKEKGLTWESVKTQHSVRQIPISISRCDLKSLFQILSSPCNLKQFQLAVKRRTDGEKGS